MVQKGLLLNSFRWEQEDQTTASCQHVRFFYSTFVQEIVYFGEDWDSASFDESFRELAHFNDDECIEEDQAFRDIIHPDVDAVVFYVQDEVMGSWAQYWGYKT